MKKLNLAILTVSFLLAFTACEKDMAFVEFEDLQKGAFARLLDRSGAFFFTDPDNSAVDISVEFYDEDDGRNVASYSWTVQYIDKENDGAGNVGPVDLLTINASEFSTNPDTGLPSVSFTITMNEVLDALGITIDDVDGGSTMRFEGTVTKNDGSSFSRTNTGPNVIASAPFSGFFSFDADLLCESDLAGAYTVVTTYDQHDFLPEFPEHTLTGVELTQVGEGQYEIQDFSGGLYSVGPYKDNYGTADLVVTITDACGTITFSGATDPWQNLLPNPDQDSFVDLETGVITISIVGDVYGEKWTSVYTPE